MNNVFQVNEEIWIFQRGAGGYVITNFDLPHNPSLKDLNNVAEIAKKMNITVSFFYTTKVLHTSVKCPGDDLIFHAVTEQLQRSPTENKKHRLFYLCQRNTLTPVSFLQHYH